MVRFKIFALAFALTACALLVLIYVDRPRGNLKGAAPDLKEVSKGVFITSQLLPENLRALRGEGLRTVVDLRPDGEAADQPSSAQMRRAAVLSGLEFRYVPIPHTSIPDESVKELQSILAQRSGNVVLYCRSGRRAVRTLALAQASQSDGPSCQAILAMASGVGFPADDLQENINGRIGSRSTEHPQDK